MKANFIIGKKQIILASLVLILGVAVYLNWRFANTNNEFDTANALNGESQENVEQTQIKPDVPLDETGTVPTETVNKDEVVVDKTETVNKDEKDADKIKNVNSPTEVADKDSQAKDKKMGDALLVNAKVVADDTYFAKAKLARTKARDTSIQTLSTILDDDKLTEVDKKDATAKAMAITDVIEAESRIENLIKAKGFNDCIVYITNANASVVVKTNGLDQNQATQIKNIVVSEGKIKGENVKISEIK